jgi:hypothetical protein
MHVAELEAIIAAAANMPPGILNGDSSKEAIVGPLGLMKLPQW